MLFRLAILFLFGIALGGLGVSRALEALSLPERNVSLSANDSGRTGDPRVLRAGERTRLPQALTSQVR
jgi:hypothetical protein